MTFSIGDRLVYPNVGVARVEEIRDIESGNGPAPFYVMRLEMGGNLAMVPVHTADTIGLRLPIGGAECDRLVESLAAGFAVPRANWKARRQEFIEKTRAGNVFDVADVLKKLTYLDSTRMLGFADKRMLERSRRLVIAEVAVASRRTEIEAASVVDGALATACAKHASTAA